MNGSLLGEVKLYPEWNGGSVERMARSISRAGSFTDLPLLADALEEAGCKDKRILYHICSRIPFV